MSYACPFLFVVSFSAPVSSHPSSPAHPRAASPAKKAVVETKTEAGNHVTELYVCVDVSRSVLNIREGAKKAAVESEAEAGADHLSFDLCDRVCGRVHALNENETGEDAKNTQLFVHLFPFLFPAFFPSQFSLLISFSTSPCLCLCLSLSFLRSQSH